MNVMIRVGTRHHPKVTRLAHYLGVSHQLAYAHLVAMWEWTMAYREAGCLSGLAEVEIARGALWNRSATKFVEAMVASGLIDRVDGVLQVHDWDEHQGVLIEERARDRERKRAERIQRKSGGRPTDVQRSSTAPSPSHPSPPLKEGRGDGSALSASRPADRSPEVCPKCSGTGFPIKGIGYCDCQAASERHAEELAESDPARLRAMVEDALADFPGLAERAATMSPLAFLKLIGPHTVNGKRQIPRLEGPPRAAGTGQ